MEVKTIKKIDSDILREVGALSRAIHTISDTKYKKLKLQKGQFIFLTRICENPGINFVELSDMLRVDKTTTTKAVQKLIEAGYVEKKQDEADKRGYKLTPTEKSLTTYDLIIEEENRNIEACFRNFTGEEKQIVNELVKKMSTNIKKDWLEIKK